MDFSRAVLEYSTSAGEHSEKRKVLYSIHLALRYSG
jgi:hypothetical protein